MWQQPSRDRLRLSLTAIVPLKCGRIPAHPAIDVARRRRAGESAGFLLYPRGPGSREQGFGRSGVESMRQGRVERKTKETEISVKLNLDGTGAYDVETGIGFLDHMLEQLSRHSLIDLEVKAKGDLHISM